LIEYYALRFILAYVLDSDFDWEPPEDWLMLLLLLRKK